MNGDTASNTFVANANMRWRWRMRANATIATRSTAAASRGRLALLTQERTLGSLSTSYRTRRLFRGMRMAKQRQVRNTPFSGAALGPADARITWIAAPAAKPTAATITIAATQSLAEMFDRYPLRASLPSTSTHVSRKHRLASDTPARRSPYTCLGKATSLLQYVKPTGAWVQGDRVHDVELPLACLLERFRRDFTEQVVSAPSQTTEQRVLRRHIFDHYQIVGEFGREIHNLRQRNPLAHKHVVDDRQHEDGIEDATRAGEKGWTFAIPPTYSRARPS